MTMMLISALSRSCPIRGATRALGNVSRASSVGVRNRFYSTTGTDVLREDLEGKEKGITVLSFNRPAAYNALSRNLVSEFEKHLYNLQFDKQARVVIIRSTVEKAFCTGADLKERKDMSELEVRQFLTKLQSILKSLITFPVPLIASIDGFAFGGGLELAMACDMRVASGKAKMGLTETSLAIIPGAGGTQTLPRIIGVAKAKELIFTSRRISGQEAFDIGLVNHVTEGSSYEKALEIAREIIPNGPIALQAAKLAINNGSEVDLNTGLTIEQSNYAKVLASKDRVEGLTAFKEKRPPVYKGE
eukprot:Nk52_evm14s280 gene=Nk52_evmTU14s280